MSAALRTVKPGGFVGQFGKAEGPGSLTWRKNAHLMGIGKLRVSAYIRGLFAGRPTGDLGISDAFKDILSHSRS